MQRKTQNKQSSSLRKSIFYFIIALFVLVFAIFIRSDADLGLFLAREKPEKAFKDKVVWVLGASSGIGAQAAVDFAKDGAKVIVSARREDKLNEVSAKCVAAGGEKAFILPLDMTDLSSHKQAFEQVKAKYGHVDILLLNAGVGLRTTANLTDFATTEELFKLNFFSFISMTKEVLPSMISRRSGKIVIISSLASKLSFPMTTTYSATKYALQGYFDALRAEVASDGIKVSIVSPGPVESEIWDLSQRDPRIKKKNNMKKMPTERCTELMLKGLYHDLDEMWISIQPALAGTYFATYFPAIFRHIKTYWFGPFVMKALEKGTTF